jgi:IS5 family transposase
VDAHGMPLRVIVTTGTEADCRHAISLIDGIEAETLFADKAYDTDEIVSHAIDSNMEVVIPHKKESLEQKGA